MSYLSVILKELYDYSTSGYLGDWRKNTMDSLAKKVSLELERSQNPADCSKAKFIVCSFNKGCGFGCQMHHVREQ